MRLIGNSDAVKPCMDIIVDCRVGPASPAGPAWRMRSRRDDALEADTTDNSQAPGHLADISDSLGTADMNFEDVFSPSKNTCKTSVTKSKYGFAKAWTSLLRKRTKVTCPSQVAPADALSSIASQQWTDDNVGKCRMTFDKSPVGMRDKNTWFRLRWRSPQHDVRKADQIVVHTDGCVELPFCLPQKVGHGKTEDAFEEPNLFGACGDLCFEFERPLEALLGKLPSCNPGLPGTLM